MQRLFLLAAAGGLFALLPGCGGSDPFAYVPVSGKVTYDDGSTIPKEVELRFLPVSQKQVDAKTYPRAGFAVADKQTGEFTSVTSHRAGDGLVPGKHKVKLTGSRGRALPADVVPPEYTDFEKTPLLVDTADKETFNLKIRKPTKKGS